jgi:hypothetical protein
MATVDRVFLQELLQRELDDDLGAGERSLLEQGLLELPDLRQEREQWAQMKAKMEAARIAVRPDFCQQVLDQLPAAAWEARASRAWRFPAAVLLSLGAVLVGLVGSSKGLAAFPGPLVGALAAAVDLLQTSLLAGAGLLGASWKGLQVSLAQLFAGSPAAVVGFFFLVVALNAVFFYGLRSRKRRPVEQPAAKRPS